MASVLVLNPKWTSSLRLKINSARGPLERAGERKKILFMHRAYHNSGTCLYCRLNPALKRRAILTMSLQD